MEKEGRKGESNDGEGRKMGKKKGRKKLGKRGGCRGEKGETRKRIEGGRSEIKGRKEEGITRRAGKRRRR
jgi:hypothetical protein